ncbi:MAG TPA: putative toxin-antitoxin system toxin component, PIN family [Rubrivivax sp.]|nr:putative toxin-antitoxin system toxin component, PIN family [Burkholderiales bacterium]HNT38755.1 putative toxin-antitoxin system toxin component, PIN family [Rubrivivax sp.]
MRAVLDTNILVSGLLRADGPPATVVRQLATQEIQPVVCAAITAEYRAVLSRRKLRLRAADVAELLALIEAQALWVELAPHERPPALPDLADWPFIACALAAACPVITGNLRHFPASLGVRTLTARAWVDGQR